jgi:hypothetical protein
MSDGRARPAGCGFGKAWLIDETVREAIQVVDQLRRQRRPDGGRHLCLPWWRRTAAQSLEGQPPEPVLLGAGMREQILCNAGQPRDADGIEACVFKGSKDLRCRLFRG